MINFFKTVINVRNGGHMNYVNKYLRNFKPYKVASHKIWSVPPKERPQILKLDWNESTQDPTPLVKEKIQLLLGDGHFFNLYPATCNDELLLLLSKYTGMPIDNIQYFGSSDSLHEYISKLFISVGDPVVLIWPSYDNFRLTAEVNGAVVHYFNFEPDFTFNECEFKDFISRHNASLVYICNPNNPTGYLHSPSFIESLLSEFPETMFLVDEAYFEFTNNKTTCCYLVSKYENLLVSRTMSKAFGIANFRFGYLISSKKNIDYISTIRNPKNITTFAQIAAMAVLEDVPYMERYVSEVKKTREFFVKELNKKGKIKCFDSEGNFVIMKFSSYDEKMNCFNFLSKRNIFVRNIDQDPIVHDCLRITIGTFEQMSIVLGVLDEFFKNN